jgi:hypothetical protein
MSYVIEEGIPLPTGYGRRTEVSRTLDGLQVDQSFHISTERELTAVRGVMCRIPPKKFSVRKESGGWRIWRIK